MTPEQIFGLIVNLAVSWSCGACFYGIGLWAERSKKPFGFWTWKEVKPESIRDIPAYNRENGKMWKLYAYPYFVVGFCAILGIWIPLMNGLALGILLLNCSLGFWWVVRRYKHIYRKYAVKSSIRHEKP